MTVSTGTLTSTIATMIPDGDADPVPAAVIARVLAGASVWLREQADRCVEWDVDPTDGTASPYMSDPALVGYLNAAESFADPDSVTVPTTEAENDAQGESEACDDPWNVPF